MFYKIGAIGFGFFVFFLFSSIILYPRVFFVGQSMLHKLDALCGCTNHWSFTNHPFIFSSIILLGLGLAAYAGFFITRVLKLKKSTSKFVKLSTRNKKHTLSPRLKKAIEQVGLEDRVIEVDNKLPIIFCFGFIKPEVCISSGFINRLDDFELASVLLHEKQHVLHNEPIKLFVVKAIMKGLFFVPSLKLQAKNYLTLSELAADEQATNGFRSKAPLARALYKLMEMREYLLKKNGLAVSFLDVTGERVNKLTNDNYVPELKAFNLKMLANILLVVFFFFGLGFFIFQSKSAIASHGVGVCLEEHTKDEEQCRMSENGSCSMAEKTEDLFCGLE